MRFEFPIPFTDGYDSFYLNWIMIWVRPSEKNPKVLEHSTHEQKVHTCREYAVQRLRYQFLKVEPNNRLLTDKASLIITTGTVPSSTKIETLEAWEQKVRNGVAIVNAYEKMIGWRKTNIFPVDNSRTIYPSGDGNGRKLKGRAMYIVGNRRWLHSPYLLSLFLLLLRLGRNRLCVKKNLSSYEGVIKTLKQIGESTGTEAEIVSNHWKYWGGILRNSRKIFLDSPMRDNYAFSRIDKAYERVEGIYRLIAGTTTDKTTFQKYKEHVLNKEDYDNVAV